MGYEWLLSGLTKLVRGDLPDGLGIQLTALAQESPGWYGAALEELVIPRAHAVGYVIELGELATGVALSTAALVSLVGWHRGRVVRAYRRAELHLAVRQGEGRGDRRGVHAHAAEALKR